MQGGSRRGSSRHDRAAGPVSDARLQDIRRSAALGDPGAEARLLVEGLRAGLLTRERVELAAYCGHKAARVALGNGPHDWLAQPVCRRATAPARGSGTASRRTS